MHLTLFKIQNMVCEISLKRVHAQQGRDDNLLDLEEGSRQKLHLSSLPDAIYVFTGFLQDLSIMDGDDIGIKQGLTYAETATSRWESLSS